MEVTRKEYDELDGLCQVGWGLAVCFFIVFLTSLGCGNCKPFFLFLRGKGELMWLSFLEHPFMFILFTGIIIYTIKTIFKRRG